MVELLVVLMLVAMASGLAGLALRDGSSARLEREAARLSALLEAARAESRASGVDVRFELAGPDAPPAEPYRFVGLVASAQPPGRWLEPEVRAEIPGANALLLGPEPLIGPQRIVLRLGTERRTLATDGLAPFAVLDTP